jgi:hypothetical protein
MKLKSAFVCLIQLVITCAAFDIPLLYAQMPKGLPGLPYYAVRKDKPNLPCTFEPVYKRIKSNKTDPRVAFIDLYPIIHANEAPVGFYGLCTAISQQGEDNLVVFDKVHAFLHILWGDPTISQTITYFSGTHKLTGVILSVTRFEDDWHSYVFEYRDSKWYDVTKRYLGPFNLSREDYIVVPQYGRTARVLTFDGMRFRHKLWLTWDGTKFTASTARKMPGWRCPDSYRYFDPSERKQYCQ